MEDIQVYESAPTISDGDAINEPVIIFQSVSESDSVTLWESDISNYSVTDGLLLLILIVLIVQTFLKGGGFND